MKKITAVGDKAAVSLSLLCTIHCFSGPLVATLLPSFTGLFLESELFHLWLVVIVVPISLYALTMGCKQHKHHHIFVPAMIGLLTLAATILLGHEVLGEAWEKILTLIGSGFVALGHILNYRLCRAHSTCSCGKALCEKSQMQE